MRELFAYLLAWQVYYFAKQTVGISGLGRRNAISALRLGNNVWLRCDSMFKLKRVTECTDSYGFCGTLKAGEICIRFYIKTHLVPNVYDIF